MLECRADALEALEDLAAGLASAGEDGDAYRGARREERSDGTAALVLTFGSARARDRVAAGLADTARDGLSAVRRTDEPDRDWVAEVAARDVAVPLGRHLAALPEAARPVPGRRGIRVRRSRAFGTGDHPSTRLAADLLEEAVRPGTALLDVGAGTGILAAVGLLSGAGRALALDHDVDACRLAAETRALNGLDGLTVVCGEIGCLRQARFELVVANIERDTLLALMPALAGCVASNGRLILSGLLVEQGDDVAAAARTRGLVEIDRRREGEWVALLLAPRAGVRPTVLIDGPVGAGRVELPADEGHHLVRVRRTREGDGVLVVDGRGNAWSGVLEADRGRRWHVTDLRRERPDVESALEIHLLVAVPHDRGPMDQIVRAAAEIGVFRLVPLVTERTQVARRRRGDAPARWHRIAREAVKQCGRTRLPEIETAQALDDVLAEAFDGPSLAFDPAGRSPAVGAMRPGRVRLLIGPEGGWSRAELVRLRDAGVDLWRLGPRILRLETAAIAAAGLAQFLWGDWNAPDPSRLTATRPDC